MLVELGAARRVGNAVELAAAVSELLADSLERQRIGAVARRAVEINRGSAQRLVKLIEAQSANALPVPPAPPNP
jgi:3-deoxy-D-manno-octulosonic-acid transferase